MLRSLVGSEMCIRDSNKLYNESKEYKYFINILKFHSLIIEIKTLLLTVTIDDVLQLDQKFNKELNQSHPGVWSWKIQKASCLKHFKKVKESCSILFQIYEEISNSKGNNDLKLGLAQHIMYYDSGKSQRLLSSIDEKDLVSGLQKIYLFRTKLYYLSLIHI